MLLKIISLIQININQTINDQLKETLDNSQIDQLMRKQEVTIFNQLTEDGQINKLYQVKPQNVPIDIKKSALFQHGLMNNSDCFMVLEAEVNWVTEFLEDGWTIFFNNLRGDGYSMNAKGYDPTTTDGYVKQWDFSLWDFALKDIPAAVNKVKEILGVQKLKYVGYSEGTMVMHIALQQSQSVRESISHYAGLAPIISLANLKSDLRLAAPYGEQLQKAAKFLGILEFSVNAGSRSAISSICRFIKKPCDKLMKIISDVDPSVMQNSDYYFLQTYPAPTSIKDLIHFLQLIKSDKYLQNFDYGIEENKKIQGQDTPPNVDLKFWPKDIKYFFASGTEDLMAGSDDVQVFLSELDNQDLKYDHKSQKWGHLGFMLADGIDELINDTKAFLTEDSEKNDNEQWYDELI